MPEGNEIHRWAQRHAAAFAGKTVRVDGPQGRFLDSEVIDGRKLMKIRAVGKHLGYDFGKDRILHVHLGLQGDFTEGSGPLPPVKGALRLRMWNAAAVRKVALPGEARKHSWYSKDDGKGHIAGEEIAWIELRGPTDCSIYTQEMWERLLRRLGPDPLNGDGPERAIEKIRKSRKPIAALLMDQTVIAGIGNIFRAELLYRAKLNPFVAGKDVPEKKLQEIWADAVILMQAGMIDRRIVTTRSEDRPCNESGMAEKMQVGEDTSQVLKEEAHYVYRRHGKKCFVCGTKVMREEMAGRNLYWCPTCQKGIKKNV